MNMFEEGKKIEKNKFAEAQAKLKEAILKNWTDIKETAEIVHKDTSQYSPDYENNPDDPEENNRWNRMQLLESVSDTMILIPDKLKEFDIEGIQVKALDDMDEYKKRGDVTKYAEIAFRIKQIWPEKFSEVGLDNEMKEKISEELKIKKNANWRVWPNIFVITKSLCPELLTEENSGLFKKELVEDAKSCYDRNWNNYLDVLVNLKILSPKDVVEVLDDKGKEEILKVVLNKKHSFLEEAAKAHIVFEK